MIFKYEGQLESEPRARLRAGGGWTISWTV